MVIDAHLHLWGRQQGMINGRSVHTIGGGRSDFGGEIRQMVPPYMIDGCNSVERLISNMDYARVNGAVVTQEYIDGNQDTYLLSAKAKHPERIRICSLYEEREDYRMEGFDGIKLCASRLSKVRLEDTVALFKKAESMDKFISIDLAEGDAQIGAMKEIIQEYPNVKIALGHFGMVTKAGWQEQIKLAQNPNVYVESGGITWLFHSEFYPYNAAITAILEARDLCGMDKLMWGSDYPRTMTAITYTMAQDFVTKSGRLSGKEKRKFLGENARRFYGFSEMDELPYIRNMVED